MNNEEIDDILRRAGQTPPDVDPAVLDRIVSSLGSRVEPVRPLPAAWRLEAGLLVIWAAVALLGAARAGFGALRKLSGLDSLLMCPALSILAWLAAAPARFA